MGFASYDAKNRELISNRDIASNSGWGPPSYSAPQQKFTCSLCLVDFYSIDDLLVHEFDGHSVRRPTIFLNGRECGRSRVSVLTNTLPEDWKIVDAESIRLDGVLTGESKAKKLLSSRTKGFIQVELTTKGINQTFDLRFAIAEKSHLDGIEACLEKFVVRHELSISTIESFLQETNQFSSCDSYRFGIANYFYGVLAREGSPHSGLSDLASDESPYVNKFEEAVSQVMGYVMPGADAICGLVAFHFNQFDVAMRRTYSPRVSRAAYRLYRILKGDLEGNVLDEIMIPESFDIAMCDGETEIVLDLCCLPFNGNHTETYLSALEQINRFEPFDQFKVRIVSVEHFMTIGQFDKASEIASPLRHNRMSENWYSSLMKRIEKTNEK
jgi:hypothetical protein